MTRSGEKIDTLSMTGHNPWANAASVDPVGSGPRPMFKMYCRRRGSRCDRIMRLIEQGWSNQAIADLVEAEDYTIQVYRDCLYDTLPDKYMADEERGRQGREITQHKVTAEQRRSIGRMYNAGNGVKTIAAAAGMTENAVRTTLEQEIRVGRIAPRAQKAEAERMEADGVRVLAIYDRGIHGAQDIASITGIKIDAVRKIIKGHRWAD